MAATRSNLEWLDDLSSSGPRQEKALADLREIVVSGLPYALSKWLSPGDPSFAPLVEEVAQETLLRVLDRMGTFEGRSQFTTWVQKIAVRLALTELRRQRWKDVSLDSLLESDLKAPPPGLLEDSSPGPEVIVERAGLIVQIQRIIQEELTEKQQQAVRAIVLQGMPLEEVARRMGTNRNALYKLLHDARLRLKRRLALNGLTPQEVLASFEEK